MASIYDVAKAAGTSIATVSYVLNKSNRVSQETTERVMKAIKDLNYQPRASAQALARGRTLTITLIAPLSIYRHQASLYSLINGIGRVLESTDYRLYIHPTLNRPGSLQEIEAAIRSQQMDGVILMHVAPHDPRVSLLRQNKIPFVLIGRSEEFTDISWVDADIEAAIETCVTHLISKGHRYIGMMGERGEANITNQLIQGFERSIVRHNLPYNPNYCIEFSDDPVDVKQVITSHLSRPDRPTAFFAVSDLAVLGVYNAAFDLHLKIPQDLAVIGYADSPIYPFMSPPCSAVFGSAFELGKSSAEILLSTLGGEDTAVKQIILPSQLIERDSTASTKK
jgi:DNA-binding LacI/PurR family transcriptional regulator